MTATWPRLPDHAAGPLLLELSACSDDPSELLQRSASTHSQTLWYPTGPRVDSGALGALQANVRDVAARHGHPEPAGRSRRAINFDQEATRVLFETMAISPVDAAQDGVWSFISLVLLPDVALWRWPNAAGRPDYERLLGRPRNVFRRLWWRAHALGTELAGRVLEDEAVSVLERPTLGGDRRLARAITAAHLRTHELDPTLPRTELQRQITKRVLRLGGVVTLSAVDDDSLTRMLQEICDDVRRVLRQAQT